MAKKIILITGARGSGKSTALAGIVPPTKTAWEQTLVFDTEDSWSDLVSEERGAHYLRVEGLKKDERIKVGEFVRAYDRFKMDADLLKLIAQNKLPWVTPQKRGALLDYYKYFIETMDAKLASGKFKYVFIDTIETVEAALSTWAEMNKVESGWSGDKTFGRLETEAVRPLYENLIEGIARRGVEVVGLTSHLKQPWEGNKPVPNKVEPGGRLKLLARISTMMVWLVREADNEDGAPAGLILKARLSKNVIENGQLKVRRVLPERMPHFTWADVQAYQSNPANFQSPSKGERMSDAEREMISEMMNDEQMRLMMLAAETELAQATPALGLGLPSDNGDGLSIPERLRRMKEQSGE